MKTRTGEGVAEVKVDVDDLTETTEEVIEIEVDEEEELDYNEFQLLNFKVVCKTFEFRNRLNLPPVVVDYLGTWDRVIKLQLDDETGVVFDVTYKHHMIEKGSKGFPRLTGGWRDFVGEVVLDQGDIVHFKMDLNNYELFHVTVERHDKAIQVDNEYWI